MFAKFVAPSSLYCTGHILVRTLVRASVQRYNGTPYYCSGLVSRTGNPWALDRTSEYSLREVLL